MAAMGMFLQGGFMVRFGNGIRRVSALAVSVAVLAGCANMTETQRHAAIGAGIGALV